jgi:hypothetical protein
LTVRAVGARAFAILLFGIALPLQAVGAKPPSVQDEAAVRGIIAKIYAAYTQPAPDLREGDRPVPDNEAGAAASGYEPPYTQSLDSLIGRWDRLMQESEELYGMNGFDWYCQCQDNDAATAKLLKQTYRQAGKARIEARILFSPGRSPEGDTGSPLVVKFLKENGDWKIDDLKFDDGSLLRRSLLQDIADASKAAH